VVRNEGMLLVGVKITVSSEYGRFDDEDEEDEDEEDEEDEEEEEKLEPLHGPTEEDEEYKIVPELRPLELLP